MNSVMKGLMGPVPLQNFWARTAPGSAVEAAPKITVPKEPCFKLLVKRRRLFYPQAQQVYITSTKGTMDPEESARNSCNSWPLYAC